MQTIKPFATILGIAFFMFLATTSIQAQGRFLFTGDASILASIDDSGAPVAPALTAFGGYQVQDAFAVGLATGMKFFTLGSLNGDVVYPYVPVQLHIEALLRKGKGIPIVFARAGYAFTTSQKLPNDYPVFDFIWGGWTYTAGLGYRYFTSDQFAVSFHVAYESQQTHFANPEFSTIGHFIKVGAGIALLK